MHLRFLSRWLASLGLVILFSAGARFCPGETFPGAAWETMSPREAGLDEDALHAFRDYVGGRGCVVRHGKMVYTWGDQAARGDVASACKPVIAHFLWKAVETGRLASLDEPVVRWARCLNDLNPELNHKDRLITFRHLVTQTACYGVAEEPGTAFDYSDWQMALLWDTLFHGVYGAKNDTVDEQVLHPLLTGPLGCQDSPTFLAFGAGDRPGRLAISVRDLARIGLLYLRQGRWAHEQLVDRSHAVEAVTRPLPNTIPRTTAQKAQMCADARTIGSRSVPDDQTDHLGSYSYLWWTNGTDREGGRRWPHAPLDTFGAFGHKHGQRALVVIPSLDLVAVWNDTSLGNRSDNPVDDALRRLVDADTGAVIPDPDHPAWLKRERGGHLYMCGPGDPEDFLYRGERRPDGTRDGDQADLISKLAGTGANCVYVMAVRSHGGDGDRTHNPFVDNDPANPLDEKVLDQWEAWFSALDRQGIVIFLFLYDDSAYPFGKRPSADAPLATAEADFVGGIVKRFRHHRHLVWCVAEEYREKLSREHAIRVAERIRAADPRHPIAIHQNHGTDFDFNGVPVFNQFAVQWNVDTPAELHAGTVAAWRDVGGRVNINMSEYADSRHDARPFAGSGDELRRKIWAVALGGGYSMILGMDIASTPTADLQACGRLVKFMEATRFHRTSPQDDLGRADTDYVLAAPGEAYIVYAEGGSRLGVMLQAGDYRVRWYDPVNDGWIDEGVRDLPSGEVILTKPARFGSEVALYLERASPTSAPARAADKGGGLRLENGWFVHNDRVVWGNMQHNAWWCTEEGANITRRDPVVVGPHRTEDLDKLTDNMLRFGYPGFEHNFGLWYDRRRDKHDTARRNDAEALPPFLEQPWARTGTGPAWDGLPKYDLTRYNAWYFDRLKAFAELCDRKGTILFHTFYMQHALLEGDTHYVDFPWRPTNCMQATEMPNGVPAANAFYDMSHPLRRELHRAYIRKCLDELGGYRNVVHMPCQEYTGPASFARFWLDVITEWEQEKGRSVLLGVGATRDVLDQFAGDERIAVLDLRYWWYQPDGTLYAPKGGIEVAGRFNRGQPAAQTTPGAIYRQLREYRLRYPGKALIHRIDASREQTLAFLFGGGSLLVRGMKYPDRREPREYEAPPHAYIIQPTVDFINAHLSTRLQRMVPLDVIRNPEHNWCLGEPGVAYLVYALHGGAITIDLSDAAGTYRTRWFDPRTGSLREDASSRETNGGGVVTLTAPDDEDWILWLAEVSRTTEAAQASKGVSAR